MPIGPKMRFVLLVASLLSGKPVHQCSVELARKANLAKTPTPKRPAPVAQVANRAVASPAGENPIRIYTPEGAGLL
jgi:acetyl esterase